MFHKQPPPQRKETRKSQSPAPVPYTPNVPVRSSQQDCRSNAIDRIFADNGYGIDKNEEEKSVREDNLVSLKNLIHSKQVRRSFLCKRSLQPNIAGYIYFMSVQHINEVMYKDYVDGDIHMMTANFPDMNARTDMMYKEDGSGDHITPQNYTMTGKGPSLQTNGNERKTTFAALPNTTTWQQQQKTMNSVNNVHEVSSVQGESLIHLTEKQVSEIGSPPTKLFYFILDDTSTLQLHNIRLKLEEKRRVIENEKRRMELIMNKQRQKVGKAAFLQAITKVLSVTSFTL